MLVHRERVPKGVLQRGLDKGPGVLVEPDAKVAKGRQLGHVRNLAVGKAWVDYDLQDTSEVEKVSLANKKRHRGEGRS